MRKGNTFPSVVVGVVSVAVVAALTVQDGWVLMFPSLLVLCVLWRLTNAIQRR